jgi:hypothetical protein
MSAPLARIGVDAFHSNVMSSLYPNGNEIIVKPVVTNQAFANTAKKAAKYMTYVMNQEANSYNVIDDADKKSQMYGIGYIEPVYCKEEVWETFTTEETIEIPEVDPLSGELTIREETKKKTEKKKKVVFDGIKINSIPVEAIYKNPFITSIEQCVKEDAVFKVFQSSYSDIKDRSKQDKGSESSYYITHQVNKIEPYVINKMTKDLSPLEQERANVDGFYLDNLSRNEMINLAEGHCWYDIDSDGVKEEVTATFHVETGTVIRCTLAPCRIRELIPRPIDERGYGEGIPKICKNLTLEWENFHNTRANAGQWENTTFGFYRAGGRLNPQQITIRPGHFYPVDDPREVQFANIPRVGSSFFQEEGLILNYFERIFALDENIQGISSKGAQTATETLRVSNKASVRFANPFNRIVSTINKVLNDIWELSQECAPADKEFYVVGEGGTPAFDKMSRNDFSSQMKFTVEVKSIFDQQLTRDTMLLAYRMYLVNPLVQQHPEMLWELSQKTLDELNIRMALPKPSQANTLSPFEEHELFKNGEDPEPEVGEDVDYHLKIHENMLKNEEIKNWDEEAVKKLIIHRDKTVILKRTLESANLNKSGMFEGNPMMPQPGMTANRNPTQMFNTMKVGESGKSMSKNIQNGQGGAPDAQMDQIMGNQIS